MVFDKYPSKITKDYWVLAFPNKNTREITDNCGKWLIFTNTKDLDNCWQKIAKATEEGILGIEAKSATAKENPNALSQDKKVICVYTYDSEDKDDVARVAWELYDLGVVPVVLNYKKDKVTLEKKYAVKGQKKICRYSISHTHFKGKTKEEFIDFFKGTFD